MARIKAITFDLWDTLLVDDSDEAERQRLGLPPKRVTRRQALHQALCAQQEISLERVETACDAVDAAFDKVWKEMYVTWTVKERLELILRALRRTLPEREVEELVLLYQRMELQVRPQFLPQARPVLEELSRHYRLGVISDTVFTPGWALRELLADAGLKDFFQAFVFSDEQGMAKPAPEVFQRAAELLGATAAEMVHVGDRELNDIQGPKSLGWRTVLVTAIKDRGSAYTQADAVCRNLADLPAIIEQLEG
jgi:HAD superfamily hydrolase (TIGR01549 family)